LIVIRDTLEETIVTGGAGKAIGQRTAIQGVVAILVTLIGV